jgi:hypothetical protein
MTCKYSSVFILELYKGQTNDVNTCRRIEEIKPLL